MLSEDERETLARWARRPKSAQALALWARIVLACADGAANKAVAAQLGVTPQTVGRWRSQFVADRLAGLSDEPRPGRLRTISEAQVEQVVTATLEQAPGGGHAVGRVNPYFRRFYAETAAGLAGLEAREHIAQVTPQLRQDRERRFGDAELPVLYCMNAGTTRGS